MRSRALAITPVRPLCREHLLRRVGAAHPGGGWEKMTVKGIGRRISRPAHRSTGKRRHRGGRVGGSASSPTPDVDIREIALAEVADNGGDGAADEGDRAHPAASPSVVMVRGQCAHERGRPRACHARA